MTKKKIILISLLTLTLLSIATYFLLGKEHPFVAVVISFFILTKLKLITITALIWTKIYLFLSASKGKVFVFIKKLTLFKGLSLTIKRFILDNVVSKWIEENFTKQVSSPIKEWFLYYKGLNFRTKIKKSLGFTVPTTIIIFAAYFGGVLESFALYAQLKLIIIGFFKMLWLFITKLVVGIVSFISGTWLAPIVEILALSWLLSLIEKIPYIGPILSKFFGNIGNGLGIIFSKVGFYFHKYIGRHITSNLDSFGLKSANYLNNKIDSSKVKNELFIFNEFEKKFLLKDIQKYFKGKFSRDRKELFYSEINKKRNDHVDIKAFIELNKSFDKIEDFFILEGLASCNEKGGSHPRINKKSFWVMNLNPLTMVLFSKSDSFRPIVLTQNSLRLVQPKNEIDFFDIYLIDINQTKYSLVREVNEERENNIKFVKFINKTSTYKFMGL